MFESPQQVPKQAPRGEAAAWEYLYELDAMAGWLTSGSDRSPGLTAAVAGMDTFRGPETVKRWIHNVAIAHLDAGPGAAALYLDRLVEGRQSVDRRPSETSLVDEVAMRLRVLESLCTIPDNYRCALLLKEGSGLTVEKTALLMGVSKASLRSILYRARRSLDT
jgi:DNA-directed RNA polymerase specialized sigma24 family protein